MTDNREKDILTKMKNWSDSGSNPTQAPINTLAMLPCFAELLVILADKQEESANRMVKQTNMLVYLTISLVILTVGLLAYTALLFHMTATAH